MLKPSKIEAWKHENRRLEESWSRPWASWNVLETFWGDLRSLEPSWERLGSILGRLGGVLGSSWRRPGAVLGAAWGVLDRLGASCGCLGGVLEVSCARFSIQKRIKFRHAMLDAIYHLIFGGSCFRKSIPEC